MRFTSILIATGAIIAGSATAYPRMARQRGNNSTQIQKKTGNQNGDANAENMIVAQGGYGQQQPQPTQYQQTPEQTPNYQQPPEQTPNYQQPPQQTPNYQQPPQQYMPPYQPQVPIKPVYGIPPQGPSGQEPGYGNTAPLPVITDGDGCKIITMPNGAIYKISNKPISLKKCFESFQRSDCTPVNLTTQIIASLGPAIRQLGFKHPIFFHSYDGSALQGGYLLIQGVSVISANNKEYKQAYQICLIAPPQPVQPGPYKPYIPTPNVPGPYQLPSSDKKPYRPSRPVSRGYGYPQQQPKETYAVFESPVKSTSPNYAPIVAPVPPTSYSSGVPQKNYRPRHYSAPRQPAYTQGYERRQGPYYGYSNDSDDGSVSY